MQKQGFNFRYLLALYSLQIIILLAGQKAQAQGINLPQYDLRRLHFGFTVNGTYNSFQVNPSREFLAMDTLKNVRLQPFLGFSLGAIVDFKVNKHLNIRFLGPNIAFAQRNLFYDFSDNTKNRRAEIESTYLNFPINIKLRSERHRNVRFYVIGGALYSHDLSSNISAPRSLNDPVVAVKPNTFSYEVGAGIDLYFPYFKLSPEIKFTQSFGNVLVPDEFVYTRSLSSLYSRILTLSFHFE